MTWSAENISNGDRQGSRRRHQVIKLPLRLPQGTTGKVHDERHGRPDAVKSAHILPFTSGG